MKKLFSITLLILVSYALTGCDTVDIENLANENEVKVTELETLLEELDLLLEELETNTNLDISLLEEQATIDGNYINLLELRIEELESLLSGDSGGSIYIEIEGRLIALESLTDDDTIYDDQWIIDFVSSYNEYDDQWISEFVTSYSEYDDEWLVNFVNNHSDYDDTEVEIFLNDLKLLYHLEADIPVYYDDACSESGPTGETTTIDGNKELFCAYNITGYLYFQGLTVYYESGEMRYEHRKTIEPNSHYLWTENLIYYYDNGSHYYSGSNQYDPFLGGIFVGGAAFVYDLSGIYTHHTSLGERDLWSELITFIETGNIS